jgi:uncharacterized protein YfaP (DUF2135 family)
MWLCACKCHKGKEVSVPEVVVKEYIPGSRNPEQLQKFVSDLVIYGKCSVELPESDVELAAIRGRMHNAAKKADRTIAISVKDGRVVATEGRKKRTTKKRSK